ncbi:MAG TPA: redoxin domain-containing protein [Balneolaceae bacterium]
MRVDIKPNSPFPDYELKDHKGKLKKLSDLQGSSPMIITLSRGHFCPKEHRFHRKLVDFYPELEVSYTELVTITTDKKLELLEFKKALGAQWTFLGDPERKVQQDLDITEYTDPRHNPMIPHVLILEPGLKIFKIYNGYWYTGRPSTHELIQDLREINQRIRFDWNLGKEEVRQAWENGEKEKFWPYSS